MSDDHEDCDHTIDHLESKLDAAKEMNAILHAANGLMLKENAAAKAEIENLRADIDNMLWNLAGCSTFALGYGVDEPFAEESARPALLDVLKLAKREKHLREALVPLIEEIQRAKDHKGCALRAADLIIDSARAALDGGKA